MLSSMLLLKRLSQQLPSSSAPRCSYSKFAELCLPSTAASIVCSRISNRPNRTLAYLASRPYSPRKDPINLQCLRCCDPRGSCARWFSESSSYGLAGRRVDVAMMTDKQEDWKPIFYFRHLMPVALLARAKLVQTVFSTSLIPLGAVGLNLGLVDPTTLTALVGIGAFSCVMLYIMSNFFRRLIGVISISRNFEQSVVRIGYLDFWGRRKTVVAMINDVEPISDIVNYRVGSYFGKVTFHECIHNPAKIKYLYLPIRGVEVLDAKDLERVFGPVKYSHSWLSNNK